MTDHIYTKFPDHTKAIQELLQKDATFNEICDDYEQVCTWLSFYGCSKPRQSKECDHARELIRNLEDEIKKALRGAGILPADDNVV